MTSIIVHLDDHKLARLLSLVRNPLGFYAVTFLVGIPLWYVLRTFGGLSFPLACGALAPLVIGFAWLSMRPNKALHADR